MVGDFDIWECRCAVWPGSGRSLKLDCRSKPVPQPVPSLPSLSNPLLDLNQTASRLHPAPQACRSLPPSSVNAPLLHAWWPLPRARSVVARAGDGPSIRRANARRPSSTRTACLTCLARRPRRRSKSASTRSVRPFTRSQGRRGFGDLSSFLSGRTPPLTAR